jgi:radical SAM protein with 4Fe4S-binding SPASM domain
MAEKMQYDVPKPNPFTLHIRLTKACNAGCTYCSSWQENPDKFMNADSVIQSLQFITKQWDWYSITPNYLTIEYVGGEILLVPPKELEKIVFSVRDFFKARNIKVRDGAQTNLIGSAERVTRLNNLFEGRIGTSIDNTTNQRLLGGSSSKYRTFFIQSENNLVSSEKRSRVPAVFTMDKHSIKGVGKEINLAVRNKRNLTVRPIFSGGSDVENISSEEVTEAMLESLYLWFMKMPIILEPHFSLLKKRLMSHEGRPITGSLDLCPFQSTCAIRSLSIEPNGDLYICQEMADAGAGKLGNALKGDWDHELFEIISSRPSHLPADCKACPYLDVCQGGCMLQSIQSGRGYFGKSDYCETWKALFASIDYLIHYTDRPSLNRWIDYLEAK